MTMLALLQLSWPRAAMLCLPLLPGGTKRYSMAVWRADQQMKGPSCCAHRNPAAFVEEFPVPANRGIVGFIGHSHQRNVKSMTANHQLDTKRDAEGKRGVRRVNNGWWG